MGLNHGGIRRRLGAVLALGAAGCVAGLAVPAAGAAAPAAGPAHAVPVKHVVVIFLENHSFDSILGFWCRSHSRRCPSGGMPSKVRLSNGAVVTPSADPDRVPVVKHSVAAQAAAINGGKMNGWQHMPGGSCNAAHHYQCVSGYRPARIPNIAALARHFAISDHTFSLGDSSSWGGHMAIVAASQDNFLGDDPVKAKGFTPLPGWGCDSDKVTTWRNSKGKLEKVPSCVPAYLPGLRFGGAFRRTPVKHIPTIMSRLDAAGLKWKLYGATASQATVHGLYDYSNGYIWSICPTFASCLDTSQVRNLVPDRRFLTAARSGRLPSFSVVTPGGPDFTNSCHNAFSMTACDNWVGQLVSALEHGPEWRSTTAFITWDDCGCFYDQVPPGTNPDGTAQGPRVPMIIVSPYARRGYTDNKATTFAGILAYTEHVFGLRPLGLNDRAAYAFGHAFNYSQAPLKPVRLVQRPLPAWAKHLKLTPALENDPT